jgi:hypothetical protein
VPEHPVASSAQPTTQAVMRSERRHLVVAFMGGRRSNGRAPRPNVTETGDIDAAVA